MGNIFYCYSLPLMHYLKALNIDYEYEGYNQNSRYPYFAFKKSERLGQALSKWDNFKKDNFNGGNLNG
ncbi:MAG: hypothetical protein PHX74_10395 [Candidatus Sumerlaeales bacterium]|nr:hypothetical protein [Candidatus Sumerlaeales bacterium]